MKNNIATQKTLKLLKDGGWTTHIVEKYNPFARKRIDMLGIIDIIAINGAQILGVQSTTIACKKAHLDKLNAHPNTTAWLKSGGLLWVVSWRKKKRVRGGKSFVFVPDIHIVEE